MALLPGNKSTPTHFLVEGHPELLGERDPDRLDLVVELLNSSAVQGLSRRPKLLRICLMRGVSADSWWIADTRLTMSREMPAGANLAPG